MCYHEINIVTCSINAEIVMITNLHTGAGQSLFPPFLSIMMVTRPQRVLGYARGMSLQSGPVITSQGAIINNPT